MARSDLPSQTPSAREPHGRVPELILFAMLVVFCALAWFSVQHVNTLWDEANDHEVAVSLLTEPLTGSGLDATQARLPMYVTAGVYAMTGPSIRVARTTSIAMGAAAIVLTFYAGRRWFGSGVAMFAAGLLSVSPFFLTFARTGLTEGDAFCPATVLLSFLAFDAYLRRRNAGRLVLFAAALGLALTAKFYTMFFIPAFILWDFVDARRTSATIVPAVRASEPQPASFRMMLAWAGAAFGSQLLAALSAQAGLPRVAALFWFLGLLILLAGLLTQLLTTPPHRRMVRKPIRWSLSTEWLVVLLLAAAVCAAICPAHVLNPDVARALVRSLVHPVEPEPMMRVWDPARLYLGVLLIKLGLPLGVLTLASLFWACIQKTDTRASVLCVSIVTYIFFLLILPLRQPFYLMSVYPLVLLVLGAFVGDVWNRLATRERWASAWIALVSTSFVYLLWGTAWSYPEFGYYGYTIAGKQWLGAESRGYRNLIQVTNDGTEDALAWLNANVPPGRRVVSYLWDDHVIDRYVATHPPKFQLVRRNAYLARREPPEIDDADFVVVALNNKTSYHDTPPQTVLDEKFTSSRGHLIWRGRGGTAMPVVEIYARVEPATTHPASQAP